MRSVIAAVPLLLASIVSSCSTCDYAIGMRVESVSHRDVAFTEQATCGPLLSETNSYVIIERSYYLLNHQVWTSRETLAGGKLDVRQLALKWNDDHHLLVSCRCERDAFDFRNSQWRDIAVVYDFSR